MPRLATFTDSLRAPRHWQPDGEPADDDDDGVVAMNPVLRAYEATIDDVSKADRSIVSKINTGDVDRYQTVISPEGIDLTAYRKNPCVLWEHGKDPVRGSLPIGRNQWIKSGGSGNGVLIAKTLFGKDDYSRALFEMYEDGTLRGWSVNLLPCSRLCSPPTKEEMRARPELADCKMMYRGGELAEYSGVAVPGNAETLSILEERGIWCPRGATESAGLASGGAAVGAPDPSALPRKGGRRKKRKEVKAVQASDIALTGPEENPVPGRSIIQFDGIYRVVIGSQVILETSDQAIAEATLDAIDAPIRRWQDELSMLFARQFEWQAKMRRMADELRDLLETGRV